MPVSITTSPGCSSVGLQLSLSYDSRPDKGMFGIAWSTSLPPITRKTDRGLPQYRDEEGLGVSIVLGAEDLAPVFKRTLLFAVIRILLIFTLCVFACPLVRADDIPADPGVNQSLPPDTDTVEGARCAGSRTSLAGRSLLGVLRAGSALRMARCNRNHHPERHQHDQPTPHLGHIEEATHLRTAVIQGPRIGTHIALSVDDHVQSPVGGETSEVRRRSFWRPQADVVRRLRVPYTWLPKWIISGKA